MLSPASREQALVLGRRYARALIAGAAAAARELAAQDERRSANPAAASSGRGRSRLRRGAARSLYTSLLLALACLALVVLNVDLLLPAAWKPLFRLVSGAILLLGGLPLAQSRLDARPLLIEQLTRSRSRPAQQPGRARRSQQRLLDRLLHATGIAMLAACALELARALPHFL